MGGGPSKDMVALQGCCSPVGGTQSMGGRTWSGVGKTAIVTGPTGTGIGLHTSRWLAERGTFVILAGRNEDRLKECEKAIRAVAKDADGKPNGDQIQIQSIQCDTSSLESCDKFVEEFEKLDRNLDLLISNAGIMAPPLTVTKDGFESQIGTNHVGHHYLAQKLLPRLKAAAPSRVVLVASMGHKLAAKWDPKDFSAVFHPTPKQYGVWSHYGNSKLANVLEARAFNKRYQAEGITAYSLHPGVVATELGRNNGPSAFFYKIGGFAMKTSEEGAGTTIHCATSPDVLPDAGSFFDRCALGSVSTAGANDELADALWEQTEKEIAAVKARPAGVAAAASSSEEKKASE